jgi:superfamily II DNA/RNA helicase
LLLRVIARGIESLQRLVLPDGWQAQGITALKAGRDVILDAPTGAGKTFVFEKFIEATGFARPAIYTVPTRALANDKYAEWRTRGWKVGIVTGDLTVAPESPVVVATLEAVQAQLRAGMRWSFLAVDEYQWLGDSHRGNHYEGALAALPRGVQLLLLSGSVANPNDVATWLRRLGRTVELIRHRDRPVPLEEIEVDDLTRGLPAEIQSFWARRLAGALREGLGPVLVFAPQRQEAERLARQFARELPQPDPLALTPEQEQALGPQLTKLVRNRVAFHHSGLTYAQRAGVIEPLAKAGQLRAVVATLGLSAGINFSLRSVMVTATHYRHDNLENEIEPSELLQMIGRAGRRGLDETGYVLTSQNSPRMSRAHAEKLKRAAPLPWAVLLREFRAGRPAEEIAAGAANRFFTEEPVRFGLEETAEFPAEEFPCGQRTDTGRARVVRRERNPCALCRRCRWRATCLALPPEPTLFWQWQRLGVLDRELRLTARGEIVAAFAGPEGLAVAAALEDRRYPIADIIFDLANLFATDRFSGTNPRWLGRLAAVCEHTYRRSEAEGFLVRGIPPNYGGGAAEIVRGLVAEGGRARELMAEAEQAGRGDLDRLLVEWRSLLKQLVAAEPLALADGGGRDADPAIGGAASGAAPSARLSRSAPQLTARWDELRARARELLERMPRALLPELPALTAEQRRPMSHRLIQGGFRAGMLVMPERGGR